VFFVYNEKRRNNHLVRVDLTEGPGKAAIARRPVNVADHTKWDVITDVTRRELAERPYRFPVKSVRWVDNKKVIAETYDEYWLERKIEMILP
jgi:hypothetical protein